MADNTSTNGTLETKHATATPVCHHTWTTEAPYKARCVQCGFIVPILSKEVETDATPQSL